MVQMSHKTTISQAHDAPQTISSGRPDTAHIGRMAAIERTASCQLLGADRNGLARKPLGLSSALTGPGKAGARRPSRSHCACAPVPPGTRRATLSCSAPCTRERGRRVCASAAGASPWSHRPLACPCLPHGAGCPVTQRRPHATTDGIAGPHSDATTCEPMARRVWAPCSHWPRGRARRSVAASVPGRGPARGRSRHSAC
jgi:hypothetical protein